VGFDDVQAIASVEQVRHRHAKCIIIIRLSSALRMHHALLTADSPVFEEEPSIESDLDKPHPYLFFSD
jgi:hypothetical protein